MERIHNYQIWTPEGRLHCEYFFADFDSAYTKFQAMYADNLLNYRHKILRISLNTDTGELYPDTVLYVYNHE